MSKIRGVLALTLAVVISASVMSSPTVAGASSSARADEEPDSHLVTTVGEFASVVRRDLGLRDTTVELSSHRFGGSFTSSELEMLHNDPRVASVDLNGLVSNDATQTDGPDGFEYPNERIPWGIDRLDSRPLELDGSYTYTHDGTGVTVYVVDSGIHAGHVEFAGRVDTDEGWDYRQNPSALASYIALPASSRQCGAAAESAVAADNGMTDQQGHGTHVAATAVGTTTGVAKGASVVPVRALDCRGLGTYEMVDEALKWIVLHHTTGPAVVNLSLGVQGFDPSSPDVVSIKNQIAALVSENVTVAISAGNRADDSCDTLPVAFEDDYQGVVGVAASGWDDEEADFSNWGDCVDLYAPGVDIASAYRDTDDPRCRVENGHHYCELSGTSMAAPHVAGVVALMLDANPSLTAAQVDAALTANATKCAILPDPDLTRYASSPNLLLTTATTSATPSLPCVPRSLARSVGTKSAELTWTEPTNDGDPSVTGYQVSTTPASAGCTAPVGTTSCTVPDLSAGQTYIFTVRSLNSTGASRASRTVSGRPTGVPDSPTVVSATVGLTTIEATIGTTLGDSNTYTVTAAPNGGTCTTTGTSCTISGLSQGTVYSVTATSTNVAGTSLASAPLTATTGAFPTAPSVSSATAGLESATLSWSATANATSYRVKNSSGNVVCVTSETSCVVTGLTGGEAQVFTVESVNSFGASASQQVSVTPDAQVGAVPGVTVTSGDKSLTVSWSAATGNDVSYTVTATGTTSSCTTTATTCTLSKLVNGRAYDIEIVGSNKSSRSATATTVRAYSGFTVKSVAAKRSRKVALTSFVVPVSTGTRTWSEKGTCRISGRFLVTPAKKTTCTLTLRTAKTKKFAATSISLRISVS